MQKKNFAPNTTPLYLHEFNSSPVNTLQK